MVQWPWSRDLVATVAALPRLSFSGRSSAAVLQRLSLGGRLQATKQYLWTAVLLHPPPASPLGAMMSLAVALQHPDAWSLALPLLLTAVMGCHRPRLLSPAAGRYPPPFGAPIPLCVASSARKCTLSASHATGCAAISARRGCWRQCKVVCCRPKCLGAEAQDASRDIICTMYETVAVVLSVCPQHIIIFRNCPCPLPDEQKQYPLGVAIPTHHRLSSTDQNWQSY